MTRIFVLALTMALTTLAARPAERAIPASRPLSKNVIEQLQQHRSRTAAHTKRMQRLQRHANCLYAYAPHAPSAKANHAIHDLAPTGDTVEIENGAVFTTYNSGTVARWSKGQPISITPNSSWFSSYDYRLVNLATGDSTQAKLSLGPFLGSPYTRRINYIHANSGEVVLDNGTSYQVSPSATQLGLLRRWQAGDTVILGDNDSWFAWGYHTILINVATCNYLTASAT